MFDNLTYKRKFVLVLIGSFGLLLIVYFNTFRKTYQLYSETGKLLLKKEQIANAPYRLNELRTSIEQLEALANISTSEKVYSHEQIFETISYFCQANHLTIRDFPEIRTFRRQNFNINISTIQLEGRYTDMVRLMYMLEREKKIGRLSSVHFYSRKNLQNNKTYLSAIIYLQLINKEHD